MHSLEGRISLIGVQSPEGARHATSAVSCTCRSGGGAYPGRCPGPAATDTRDLPIRRVVLYKSGIGFFEHVGRVTGNQRISVPFTSAQLDDVLKTLTVLDLDGGRRRQRRLQHRRPVGSAPRRDWTADRRRRVVSRSASVAQGRARGCGARRVDRRRPPADGGRTARDSRRQLHGSGLRLRAVGCGDRALVRARAVHVDPFRRRRSEPPRR